MENPLQNNQTPESSNSPDQEEDPGLTRPSSVGAGKNSDDLRATLPTKAHQEPEAAPEEEPSASPETEAGSEAEGLSGFADTVPSNLPQDEQAGAPIGGAASFYAGPPDQPLKPKSRRGKNFLWALLGILGLLVIAAASAFSGYQSGINLRKDAEKTQVGQTLQEQFDLGVQDLNAGYYDRARQRFEYVLRNNPAYPGAADKLSEALMRSVSTATPTPVPTPTITPTPDLRNTAELYDQAQQSLANGDWTAAIDTLLAMRKSDPAFNPVQVDDMLFIALRNRGADKILRQADLEGGIYDLSLAERFGPLDTEAESYLSWARLYILGASFWEIDWGEAVKYFSQVAPAMPNLMDGSKMTATERYRRALIGYGDQLMNNDDPCGALEQYQTALDLGTDSDVEEAVKKAKKNCADTSGDASHKGNSASEEKVQTEAPVVSPTVAQPPGPSPTEVPSTEAPVTEVPATEAPTPSPGS